MRLSKYKGNCYTTCEALYHLLGGKKAGYIPIVLYHEGSTHWVLKNKHGEILDPTVSQFSTVPNYKSGRGCGFLTKKPSKRAKELIKRMVWAC